MDSKEEVFRSYPIPKALAEFAIPMIISQLVTLVYNLADTYYLGRLNDPYVVAAVSLALPVFNVTIAIANLCGTGGGSLISRLLGAGQEQDARRVSAFSISLSALLALLFSALCLMFMSPLLQVLGASSETVSYARQYLSIIVVIGALPTILTLVMANLARSVGYARQSGFGLSLGGVLNVLLDPLFMFVLLPKGYEVIGAAVATMLSNLISAIYFFILLWRLRKKTVLSLDLRAGPPSAKLVGSIFSVGIPAALTTFLYDLTNIVINVLTASHGDIALAAIGIVLKAERLPLNIGVGICQGMIPLIAYNYSAGNRPRQLGILRFSRLCGLVVSALCILLYELFAGDIIRIFIDDPETVSLGTSFIRARCLATFFMFLCFNFVFYFQALGLGKISLLLACIRQLGFNIPILFLFNHLFGVYGIVWTQLTADACTAGVSFLVFLRVEKRLSAQAECPLPSA